MEQAAAIFVVVLATLALGFFAFRKGKACSCGHGGECNSKGDKCSNSSPGQDG